jgi:hypothetical protein
VNQKRLAQSQITIGTNCRIAFETMSLTKNKGKVKILAFCLVKRLALTSHTTTGMESAGMELPSSGVITMGEMRYCDDPGK